MIIGSKNRGDWSELYVLLYLLGTRKLYAADEHLNRIGQFCYPIRRIMRTDEPAKKVDFALEGVDSVRIYINSELSREMTSSEFKKEAEKLYRDILGSERQPIDIPHAEQFLNDIYLVRLAAPSDDITDITMELHDVNTGLDQVMGFSIKSYLGGSPTLLNASGATNFIYEVTGITDEQMHEINSINSRSKIKDRIAAILNFGGKIKYTIMSSSVFAGNLVMIDTCMEDLLAEILLYSYINNEFDCKIIIDKLEIINPLGFPRKGMYAYKFKQFLCAKALGMEPSKEWSGEDDSNGGYIVAKSDGDVLAYHLYNRDMFKQYLLDSTKLERPSTSRHKYAIVYKYGEKMYINLNLQIRFK